ncbi:hypothetical protein ACMFMG_006196 [Clarireedia jacksonii]
MPLTTTPGRELVTVLLLMSVGSHGFACIRLAKAFPSLNLLVQDLLPVVAAGSKTTPPQVTGKIQFMAYDFTFQNNNNNNNLLSRMPTFLSSAGSSTAGLINTVSRSYAAISPHSRKGARIVVNGNACTAGAWISAAMAGRATAINGSCHAGVTELEGERVGRLG